MKHRDTAIPALPATPRRRLIARAAVVGFAAALALGGCSAAAPSNTGDDPAAGDWTPEYVDGVLQPLPDGFPERTITLLVMDEVGSTDSVYARAMQEIFADIAPVDIEVVERPSTHFGTWEGAEWMAQQSGGTDGYWIGATSIPAAALDLVTVPEITEAGTTLDSINLVAATEKSPHIVIQRKNAPWGDSYEGMVEWAKEHPGELRYLSRGVGSAIDMIMTYMIDQGGYEVHKIVGGNQQETAATVGAGEADFALVAPDTALIHWQQNKVDVTMNTGSTSISPWDDVPSAVDLGYEESPFSTVRGWLAAPEVPDIHRAWLYEMIKKAVEDSRYAERVAAQPGMTIDLLDHDGATEVARNAEEIGKKVDALVER